MCFFFSNNQSFYRNAKADPGTAVNPEYEATGFLELPMDAPLVLPSDKEQANVELFSRLPIQPDHLPFLPPPHLYKTTPVGAQFYEMTFAVKSADTLSRSHIRYTKRKKTTLRFECEKQDWLKAAFETSSGPPPQPPHQPLPRVNRKLRPLLQTKMPRRRKQKILSTSNCSPEATQTRSWTHRWSTGRPVGLSKA